jgi:hypothetical protein
MSDVDFAARTLNFKRLENFVLFQAFYSIFCVAVTLTVWAIYRTMNTKASQLLVKTKKNVG